MSQELRVVPDSCPAHHHVSVVIRHSFGDPETASAYGTGEVPGPKLQGPEPLDVPNVEELVGQNADGTRADARGEPDLGAAFIDRILSPAVQKGMAEFTIAAPSVSGIELEAKTAAVVPYPESRMREMKLYVLDWNHINPQRSAILDKFNQVFGS